MKFFSLLWHQRTLLTTILLSVIVGYTGDNSIWQLIQQWQVNSEIKADIKAYDEEYALNTERYERLKSSQEAVEEVARVSLMMKSDDEDIYIIETKK